MSTQICVRADDVARVIHDYLRSRGLIKAMVALEEEAGIRPADAVGDAAFLRDLLLRGAFDDAIAFLSPLSEPRAGGTGAGASGGRPGTARGGPGGGRGGDVSAAATRGVWEIRRQQFLELVASAGGSAVAPGAAGRGAAGTQTDVNALVRALKALEGGCSRDEYNGLCYLLTAPDIQSAPGFAAWTPYGGRLACYNAVRHLVEGAGGMEEGPRTCPPGALLSLVRQAVAYAALSASCMRPGGPVGALPLPPVLNFDVLGSGDGGMCAEAAAKVVGAPGVYTAETVAAAAACAARLALADVLVVDEAPFPRARANGRGAQDPSFVVPAAVAGPKMISDVVVESAAGGALADVPAGKPTAPRGVTETVAGALSWPLPSEPEQVPAKIGAAVAPRAPTQQAAPVAKPASPARPTPAVPARGNGSVSTAAAATAAAPANPVAAQSAAGVASVPPTQAQAPFLVPPPGAAIAEPIPAGRAPPARPSRVRRVPPPARAEPGIEDESGGDSGGGGGNGASEGSRSASGSEHRHRSDRHRSREGRHSRPAEHGPVEPAASRPDGRRRLSGPRKTAVAWEIPKHGPPSAPETGPRHRGPDGSAASGPRWATVDTVLSHFRPTVVFEDSAPLRALASHPFEPLIAAGTNSRRIVLLAAPRERGVPPPSSVTGYVVGELQGAHEGSVYTLSWSPSGRMLVSCSNDGSVRTVQVDPQTAAFEGGPHIVHTTTATIRDVCFFDDTIVAACGGGDCAIRLWDLSTRECVATLVGHSGTVFGVRPVATAQTALVSAGEDGLVRIWDIRTQTSTVDFSLPVEGGEDGGGGSLLAQAHCVDVDPSGTLVASGWSNGCVAIHDVRMSRTTVALDLHKEDIRSVAWAPSGGLLLSGSFDATAGVSRMGTSGLQVVAMYRRHRDKVLRGVWCSAGVAFATASADKTVVLWESERGDLGW